jgi:hypothetical protein
MGREGAADLALNREYDQKAAMQNPNSEVSQRYQTLFAERYPDYAEQIQGVPAAEIEVFAKHLQEQEKMEYEAEKSKYDRGMKDRDYKLREKQVGIQDRAVKVRENQAGSATTREVTMPDGTVKTEVVKPNKAVEALDRDYVKDYNDWTSGGKSDYQKNRKLLENALGRLKAAKQQGKQDEISGRGVGIYGKAFDGSLRSEDSLKIQQDVEQAAMGGLKATVGANPTEGERKEILQKAYDPKLSVDSNIDKILSMIDDFDAKAAAKEEKAQHFEQTQTLGGYKGSGKAPMRVIEPNNYKVPDVPLPLQKPASKPLPAPTPGTIVDGHVFLGGDPSKQNNWRKVQQ